MKVKKINFIYLISMILLACLLFAFLPMSLFKNSSADEKNNQSELALSDSIFSIDVIGRNGKLLFNSTTGSFNGEEAQIYKWEEAEKFVFNIDTSSYTPPIKYDEERNPYYDVSIIIDYVNGYAEKAIWDAEYRVHFETLDDFSTTVRGTDSHLTLSSKFKPEFNIDKGVSAVVGGETRSAKEWGIYKFTLSINGALNESNFIIIEPTKISFSTPKPNMKVTTSDSALRTAYLFTLENEEEYRYIDKSKLIWYAKGQTQDGKLYSYTSNYIENKEEFKGSIPLYSGNKEQTGLTFKFDDNGKYGKWDIWCEYQADENATLLPSNHIQIETKMAINYIYIILICVGVALIAIGTTIGIGLHRKKKEKVY